jgi:small subunit ribosomal protein S6
MIQYEVAVIYHPDLEMDLTKATKKIEKIFEENKVKITKTDKWGKRKLAYKIDGQEHGIYIFYTVELDPQSVGKIDGALRITDEVIRYLITKPDLKAIAKANEAKVKRDKSQAKQTGKSDDTQSENEEE